MANVALFRSGQLPAYLRSVETSLYVSDPDALINPNVTAVLSVPLKYWKRVGSLVQPPTATDVRWSALRRSRFEARRRKREEAA